MSADALDQLECPICRETAFDAVECSACSRIFCERCVSAINRCAICRASQSYKPSTLARRITANLPCQCKTCGLNLTRGTINEHEVACGPIACPAPNCDFKVQYPF